ncbi:MAG TPA: zf-HC2 domain-containing protein [Vicinamibacteria bacterium]|nr:zf-HC2 domain-containing protein [Vicinamibacteria bacterium]
MNCDEVRERLVALWQGDATPVESAEIEGHLAACFACDAESRDLKLLWYQLGTLPEEEPGPGLRARFDVMLEAYRAGQKRRTSRILDRIDRRLSPFFPRQPRYQLAAALALLTLGGILGARLTGGGAETTAGRIPVAAEEAGELAVLSSEVRDLRNLVALSLLRQPSSSERLRGVSFSHRLSEPEPDVLDALIDALDHDPNVNVRLAAIDALMRFADREPVRDSLLRSLPEQESPLVQIALIDLMVRLGDRSSLELLRTLTAKPELHPAVRERARWGVGQIG